MEVSRRDFLKMAGASAVLVPLAADVKLDVKAAKNAYGVLVDTRRCVDCKACQIACKTWWDNEPEPEVYKRDFDPNTWTFLAEAEVGKFPNSLFISAKRQCMHCVDPACVAVCPTGALHKEEDGIVLWDSTKCIGCKYCVMACPYGVPRFDEETKEIRKCVFCAPRVRNGMEPACVATCPTEALKFGRYEEIRAMAEKLRDEGYPVYGLEEGGGTSWIYVFPKGVDPHSVGLPKLGKGRPSERLDKNLVVLALAAISGAAVWGYFRGKEERETEEGRS